MTSSLQRDVGIAFALALAIIIALGASQYRASRSLAVENQWVTHTEDVLRELAVTRDRQNRATANVETNARISAATENHHSRRQLGSGEVAVRSTTELS